VKKRVSGRTVFLGFIASLVIFVAGCANKDLQGHWVDVNGDTTLDLRGGLLKVTSGEWSETYRVKVKKTGYGTVISGTGREGLGIMSELEVLDDGSLRAYEQVMDAEGHQYRFVREDALEAELKVQDLSKDAPKEILSTEIESFSLSFRKSYSSSYGLDDRWESGRYSWSVDRMDDGSYQMSFSISGDSYMIMDFRREVSAGYAEGLAKLLAEQGIHALNGYYEKNNVNKAGYMLYVDYTSGENLTVRAEGDPGDTCVFDIPALLEYAARQELFSEDY